MRSIATSAILGALVSVAAASAAVDLLLPDAFHLAKRQDPSYQCHSDCGYAILNARNAKDDGYCKDPEWTKLLEDCLDCALKYEIWKDYGKPVSAAAKKCDLDATPKPADGDDASPKNPVVPPVVTESEPAAKESTAATSKADAPTADASKADAPTADASKADAPTSDAPTADASKADASKTDASTADASKADASTADASKAGASTAGASTPSVNSSTQLKPSSAEGKTAATVATATTAARNGIASVKSSPAAAASAAASFRSNSTAVPTSPAGPDSTKTTGEPVRTSGASSNMLPGLIAAGVMVLIAGGLSSLP